VSCPAAAGRKISRLLPAQRVASALSGLAQRDAEVRKAKDFKQRKSFGGMLFSDHQKTPYRKPFWTPAFAFTPRSQKFLDPSPFRTSAYLCATLRDSSLRVMPLLANCAVQVLKLFNLRRSQNRGQLVQFFAGDLCSCSSRRGLRVA
jgi:hypothetical protein